MQRRTRWIAGGVLVAGLLVGGAGVAVGAVRDDDGSDTPITGPALEQASQAALDHTGGGTVTGTEVGDEEGAYEVEVTPDDGSMVDVHLDERFRVLGDETDGAGEERDG